MRHIDIDFSRIQTHEGSKQKGFEEFVCQLAKRSKPANAREFIRKDGAGGDAGVECYWELEDGSEHAWQAKYFLQPLTPAQWSQISKSVETALEKHPDLTMYYICLPKDRNDSRRLRSDGRKVTTELDRWYQHVRKWRSMAAKRSMDVEFVYWGKHEIISILTDDLVDNTGMAEFWFDTASRTTLSLTNRHFPTNIVDQKINDEIDTLRKCRFFMEFDRIEYSLTLARKLTVGELSGGSDSVRSKALGWCIRLLSDEQLDKAESYLEQAREIGPCPEIDIAAAFIASRKGDKAAAMQILAKIDSTISRSASLMVVAHHDSPREAVDWLMMAGIDASDLDADGKRFLLACYFELTDWEASWRLVDGLTKADFRSSPTLYHMTAVTHLLAVVPDELRSGILYQPPFDVVNYPLASNSEAIEARKTARRYFINAANAARQLDCPFAGKIDDEYALWLELMDPEKFAQGRQRLESKLRGEENSLSLVRLGIQFDIKLDLVAIEGEVDRQIALNGGSLTYETAIARLGLVFGQPTPAARADYIVQHSDSLSEFIDTQYLQFVQIELLARAGQIEEAKKRLNVCLEGDVVEEHESRLRGIIADAQGADPLERYKERFREEDSLHNLQLLVQELETRCNWEGLCDYGEILYQKTGALEDAVRFATALFNTQANDRLARFLKSKKDLLAQSKSLQSFNCWILYIGGALLDARREMSKLHVDWDHPAYRTLQVNLAISLGDWNSVSQFVTNECKKKHKRNAPELLRTALLALRLDSGYQAKDLLFAAVQNGNDDANVLATAYHIAIMAGWEDQEVSQWIQRAVALSGDEGPIQKVTLRELLDLNPEWQRRDSEVFRRLMCGDLPMFLAAQLRNMSLGSMVLYSALANLDESDPRRRDVIPAYSGQRQQIPLKTGGPIGLDATSMLTLSFLNALEKALGAFDTVHIPHSTLGWIFEEKQRLTFHQPSRIRDAHQLSDLVFTGTLELLSPNTVPDTGLSELVGHDLAQLIAEAETVRDTEDSQRVVVRPAPVYRMASLLEEEADLTSHEGVLSSCQSIVEMLQKKGQITENEVERASAFLGLQEKPWPNQPPIAEGAFLYLDDLAVRYFLHLGILGKLNAAGFRLIISQSVVSEAKQYIRYERIAGEAKNNIECLRSALNAGIESGKIKVSRRTNPERESENQAIFEHPTAGVFSLASQSDAIILDDRSLNQHANIVDEPEKTQIVSSLDLIDTLVAAGVITDSERLEYRTRLRQAGYFFVPIAEDELVHHLNASFVEKGRIVESAELKAIRENILQIRMGTWLQLPKEETWLTGLLQTCRLSLARLWRADVELEKARARSEWILRLIDVRGWAHTVGIDRGEHIVKTKYVESILTILSLAIELPPEVSDDYRRWVEERVLAPLKEQNPEAYRHLLESYKSHISHVVDKCMTEMKKNDD